jgi:DNA-binding transcriptional LysR family regulator
MELRQLRYFVAVAEEKNYGGAAARLRISKPTLSQQISVLERSLGAILVERGHGALALTPAGAALLREARTVLAAADRARTAVETAHLGEVPLNVRVSNGVQHLLGKRLLALERDPRIKVSWTVTSAVDAEEAILTGRADAAVGWLPGTEHSTLHAEQVYACDACLVLSDDHRLAALDVIPVAALRDEPVAMFPRYKAAGLWDLFTQHLLPDGPKPGQIITSGDGLDPMRGFLKAAFEGRAVGPYVAGVAVRLLPAGMTARQLDPPLQVPVYLVSREPTRPALRRLAEVLRRED